MTVDFHSQTPQLPDTCIQILVLRTVIEPLRREWQAVHSAAISQHIEGNWEDAVRTCRDFIRELSLTTILDPACGGGAVLCAVLDQMMLLEAEVLDAMVGFAGNQGLETAEEKFRVGLSQFLGIEIDPQAAAAAELALHKTYLKWRPTALGASNEPEPGNSSNIECRDALLDYDTAEALLNKVGLPITRWDGKTLKPHPTTGEPVPDHNFRLPVWRYLLPRKAQWPDADFIIGSLPFLTPDRVRATFGDAYFATFQRVHPEVPAAADHSMYWWNQAAQILKETVNFAQVSTQSTKCSNTIRRLRRFGFITPNPNRNNRNLQVLQRHLSDPRISLTFAIPEYLSVDPTSGSRTRIAITVARFGQRTGLLQTVQAHGYSSTKGRIHPDLTTGAYVASAMALIANQNLAHGGIHLEGNGFIVTQNEARKLGLHQTPDIENILRPYCNGTDLTQVSRNVLVVDLFGHSAESIAANFPIIYKRVYERVKPERDKNREPRLRADWWLHGNPQPLLRDALAGLSRYIATVRTMKHRLFLFLDAAVVPDHQLIAIALTEPYHLGILSSRIHTTWSTAAGKTYDTQSAFDGKPTHSTYDIDRCFNSFPFPTLTIGQASRIGELAERLDAHRKQQQALHPRLTLAMIYNVLEKMRSHQTLTARDHAIHRDSQLASLIQIHEELDAAVAEAYGWSPDISEEEILSRLVELNHKQTTEEARGMISHLRPQFQSLGTLTEA